jgi:hypothetical protein
MFGHSHRGWDRSQWVGEGQGDGPTPRAADAELGRWNYAQWVGEGQGDVQRPGLVNATGEPGTPNGFTGFGVADSGGQRWAPEIGGAERRVEEPAEEEADEAVA